MDRRRRHAPSTVGLSPYSDALFTTPLRAEAGQVKKPLAITISILLPGLDTLPSAGRIGRSDEYRSRRSEEHTSELQSLMRNSYAVFYLHKKTTKKTNKKR